MNLTASDGASGLKALIERSEHISPTLRAELLDIVEHGRQESEEQRQERERKASLHLLQDHKTTMLRASGLKGDMWEDTFASFRTGTPSQNAAKAALKRWIASYPDASKGIALYGDKGTGKSHLLRALVQAMYDRRIEAVYDVKYAYVPGLEKWIGYTRPETTPIDQLFGCDIACLDDLSKLRADSFKEKELARIIGRLFDQAESTGQPRICLTSNEPASWYLRFDGPFEDRLKICDWIKISGESWR